MDPVDHAPIPADADEAFVARLRERDVSAFKALLGRYHRATVRLAAAYLKSEAAAEETAQEAWITVLHGVAGFEGRSSFKAWLFRIVASCAKERAAREAQVPMSALQGDEETAEPAVDPGRFGDSGRWVGHWTRPPEPWSAAAEERLLSGETRALILKEIDALPPRERQVITIRDIGECTSEEACEILGITEANQRVLLHRARSRLRLALEGHVRGEL